MNTQKYVVYMHSCNSYWQINVSLHLKKNALAYPPAIKNATVELINEE